METIVINDDNLCDKDIQKFGRKVRAVLLIDNKILVSHYGGVVLLPGGSIDEGETAIDAIIRELQEETGVLYDKDSLKEFLTLKYYQANYPTRENEVVNRLMNTIVYFGNYKGINLNNVHRTQKEIKDSFHLELMDFDVFNSSLNTESDNQRKKYFDRENKEVVRTIKRFMTK